MTELRQQNLQSYTDQAISRRRYRDNEIPCRALKKDPDGGLKCTARGLAQSSPKLWYGYDSVGGAELLSGDWTDLIIDAVQFTNDDDAEVLSIVPSTGEVEVLVTGDVEIEVKVTVETTESGRWDYEIVISEDKGMGHVRNPTTISNGGRGNL